MNRIWQIDRVELGYSYTVNNNDNNNDGGVMCVYFEFVALFVFFFA